MTFLERLESRQKKQNTLLCVGLDPSLEKIPKSVLGLKLPVLEFNKHIINATHSFVCAYKPQIAYYSAIGAEAELEMTIRYIQSAYPDIPVILDSKRGDIGPTAEMYAKEAFTRYKADAVTINPFLGIDSAKPFIDYKNKGVVVLCRTSNKSASFMQDIKVDGKPLFAHIAREIMTEWNYNKNILLVAGATYPQEIKMLREIVPEATFLVPGIGAQGGSIEEVIKNGARTDGSGLIISSSRAIIHASSNDDFAEKAFAKAQETCREISDNLKIFR
ncbi:MAG TPA: orotidine-5'-phosphate decarboxylase [Fibrobacteres bacterium]|nr:orotidine-5'-phosphate decarboxylase [Fibrobacterota bacterium]